MKDFWRAAKLASKNKKLTFLAIFVALLTTLISLIQPLVYKEFFDLIDDALAGGSSAINSNFWYIVLAYTAVIFARDLSNSWEYYAVVKWWVESKKS